MKVLIADDEVVSRRLLESLLRRWGYDVVVAQDGLEAARMLKQADAPKLAILDWLMPGLDGAELCRDIRLKNEEVYTYIILLTSKRGKADVIEGLDAGADDYIMKPFEAAELRVRVRTGKRILSLQDQLISAREALRTLAMQDSLTGLWNHAAALDILSKELSRAHREQATVGILLIDLDHFKRVNDKHGHQAGDAVLREVSRALREHIRPYDAVGRYGGEEMLVVLPGCDATNAVSHAERLRLAISQLRVPTSQGCIQPTASIGVVVSDKNIQIPVDQLIGAADIALYRAKESGRNRVELADALELVH